MFDRQFRLFLLHRLFYQQGRLSFLIYVCLSFYLGDSKPTENKLTTGETKLAPSNGASNNQNGQRKTAVAATNGNGQAAKAATDYNRYDSGISSFSSDESEEENENMNR